MKVTHVDTIVFVRDMAISVAFYRDVLGQTVRSDFGTIVMFEGGLTIHAGVDLLEKVYKTPGAFSDEPLGRDNLDIYFETDDLDGALAAVVASGAAPIHSIEAQTWGQRVFRFQDPDGHIVEIGDPM